jgi:tyrosine-protein kinase Etk/Wzc
LIEQVAYGGQSSALLEKEMIVEGDGATSGAPLLEYLTRLAHYKRFILICALAAAVLGAAYSFWIPQEFMSTTRIMTPQQTQSSAALLMAQLANSGGSGSLMSAASGSLGLKNPNDLYVGLLTSRPIADAIIQRFGLAAAYKAGDMTSARKKLAMNTQVRVEKSGFIAVTVTDNSKTQAADIANAYTDELRNLTKTLAVTEASQRRIFYEEQLTRAKEDLVAAEISFQQVEQKKGVVQPDAQVKAVIEGLAAIQARVAAKQVELQALRSYSTESNPSVQLAENQLSTLQAEASRMDQRSHASRGADFGLQDVASAGIDYLRAARELQYRQGIFDLLLKQYDAARLDEAKEAAVIQIVEPAIPPDKRSSPHRSVLVILFTLIGFLGPCAYLYLRELQQRHPAVMRSLGTLKTALLKR